MTPCLQFLTKFVRKKTAFWGLGIVLCLFLLSTYSGAIQKHDSFSPIVGAQKRLQTIENGIEPVQFVPGVPGHKVRVLPQKPPNHSDMSNERAAFFKIESGKHNPRPYNIISKDKVYHSEGGQQPSQLVQQGRERMEPQMMGAEDNVELGETYKWKNIQQDTQSNWGGGLDPNRVGPLQNNYQVKGGYTNPGTGTGGGRQDNAELPVKPYIPKQRLVHFDLKGAPPKVQYLKTLLPLLKEMGATGILWEWEDTFPFTGRLAGISASNHYTEEDVKELLSLCTQLGLDSVPLVQTFGHMEFILKLDQFKHLRDAEEMPESICPCHNDTFPLLTELISQVMRLHHTARNLHIGCDEVYHLGTCQPCLNQHKNTIFVDHVSKVAEYVIQTYSVLPIIWDDMLRNFMEDEMQPLSTLVEPMVWVYAEDVYRFMPSFTWDRLSNVFPYLWTASAYKGAHGETLVVPDANRHLVNNLNWLEVMKDQEPKLKGGFRGIALTGWQRYDHFAVLCELLPAGLPSLALDLLSVTQGGYNTSINQKLYSSLSCPQNNQALNLVSDRFLWNALSWCYFPGANIFRLTEKFVYFEREVKEFFERLDNKKGWFTQYSKDHDFSSSFRIDEEMSDWSRFQHEIATLMKTASSALNEAYDYHTQGEWIEQKLYPIYRKLSQFRQAADELKSKTSWPRRPFPVAQSLKELGIGVPPSPPSPAQNTSASSTPRSKRRVQGPDLYSSRSRLRALGQS